MIVGNGFTVIVFVFWQLLEFVNVIVAVPADTPVTTPAEVTVAIAVFEDTHGVVAAPAVSAERLILWPTQTELGPVNNGKGLTTKLCVAFVVPHSLVIPKVTE